MNILPLIKDNLTALGITNIKLPNESFKPTLGTRWVRLSVTEGEPTQVTTGINRLLRYSGTVQIDVFSALNDGEPASVQTIKNHYLKFANRFIGDVNFPYTINSVWSGNTIIESNFNRNIIFLRWFLMVPTPV